MRKYHQLLLLIFAAVIYTPATSKNQNIEKKARLVGADKNPDQKRNRRYYINPIFSGDYPDPSILRDGDDYYMVHTSCYDYPGLLIWHSKDLINWTPLTTAIKAFPGSVWAPDLVKYKTKYYIYFPVDGRIYVVTADAMSGPWSDPVDLKIKDIKIDPGHVTDEMDKRYLYFHGGDYIQLSDDGLSIVGELKHAYDGWPIPSDWIVECDCHESPKLVKREEYYYLTTAQGGTAGPATSHMVVSARSKSPFGPWENSPYNPIIHTKSISEKWWSKGHGTLFEDAKGDWWMVFHAYENGHYNRGRSTLLLPVEWTKDGWYKIPDGVRDDQPIKRPDLTASCTHFTLSDHFDGKILKPHWKFFGEYNPARFSFPGNGLDIRAKGDSVGNCSPMLCIPSSNSYTAEVELRIGNNTTGGIVLFYNNKTHVGVLAGDGNILTDLNGVQTVAAKNAVKDRVFLRIKNSDNYLNMYYSIDGKNWNNIRQGVDVSEMHHNKLGSYLSLRIGLCSMGKESVLFKNFIYNATPMRSFHRCKGAKRMK